MGKMTEREQATKDKIVHGEYTSRKHDLTGRVGRFYRVIQDVFDENDVQLVGFYQCRVCSDVIECNVCKGTAKLNRHANYCAPEGSTSQASSVKQQSGDEEKSDENDEYLKLEVEKGISQIGFLVVFGSF